MTAAPEHVRAAAHRLDHADDLPDHHRDDLDLVLAFVLAHPTPETTDA